MAGETPPYVDRVQETSTTTGTGAVTLAGAVQGYQTFADNYVTGNRVYYCITDGTNWEVGAGVYNSVTPSISRDLVFESSNADALVNFPAGSKLVFETNSGLMMIDRGMTLAHLMCVVAT
jgi:hypothetical protein